MVTIDPKLTSAARLAQKQATQRLLVLQATRAGMETLMKAGDGVPQKPLPPTPPQPGPVRLDLVARTVTTGESIPVRHLPGDVASAYAQIDGDVVPLSGREPGALRNAVEPERIAAQPRAEGSAQTPLTGAASAQGLVGIAHSSRRVDPSEEGQRRARSWSLRWWGPSEASAAMEHRPVPLKQRLAIAAALVLLGLVLAAML